MDASLVHRVMSRTTGADVHTVSGLVQEYALADRLANSPDDCGLSWHQTGQQIEHCLRLYIQGTPIDAAKRLSGLTS